MLPEYEGSLDKLLQVDISAGAVVMGVTVAMPELAGRLEKANGKDVKIPLG